MENDPQNPPAEPAAESSETKKEAHAYLLPGAIVVAGLLIAGAVFYSNITSVPEPAAIQSGYDSLIHVAGNMEDDDPVLGDPAAPVTVVEFSDFECPYCKQFFAEAEQKIIEKYVKTSQVKFIYRDFPLVSIHTMAQKAAEAGECADDQEKFWEYHDMVFGNQEQLSVENLKLWAWEVGMDRDVFNQCLDSGKQRDEVEKDQKDGIGFGVESTPNFFVNGRLVQGALPFEDYLDRMGQKQSGFDSLIQAALEEKK